MWKRSKSGCRIIIWAGLLLLLLLLPVSLLADDPLGELQQILNDYKRITIDLQKDWQNANASLISLGSSVPQMRNDIETLIRNSKERELRLTTLESQLSQDRIDQTSSQMLIENLKTGLKSMEKDLRRSRIKSDLAIAATVILAIGFASYMIANPP